MDTSRSVRAVRISLDVSSRFYKVDRSKFPNSTLTEGQIEEYKALVTNNPKKAYRDCPPELYHVWKICAVRGLPVRYNGMGVEDEDAGEKDGYRESYGRGHLLYNTSEDHKRRIAEQRLVKTFMEKELVNLEEQQAKELEELRKKNEEGKKKVPDEISKELKE